LKLVPMQDLVMCSTFRNYFINALSTKKMKKSQTIRLLQSLALL
jgi:hypothetical protein